MIHARAGLEGSSPKSLLRLGGEAGDSPDTKDGEEGGVAATKSLEMPGVTTKAWDVCKSNESNQLTHAKLCQIGFWSEPITANRLRREQGIGFVGAWVSWYPASSGRSQLCWNIARFRWQMWTVPIMWPSCGHGLKKKAPNLQNSIIFTNSSSASGKNFNPCLYVFLKDNYL